MDFIRQVVRFYSEHLLKKKLSQEEKTLKVIAAYQDSQQLTEALNASEVVKRYNHYLKVLRDLHTYQFEIVDWDKIATEPQPEILESFSANYDSALATASRQKLSFLDKVLGRSKMQEARIDQGLEKAKEVDDKTILASKLAYKDWVDIIKIARGVLSNDASACKEATDYFHLYKCLYALGIEIDCHLNEGESRIYFYPNLANALPRNQSSLSENDSLQIKPLSQQALHFLQSEYIAAVGLRIAIETLSCLPIQSITIDGLADRNPNKSISKGQNIIFSLAIDREELSYLSSSNSATENLKQFRHRFAKPKRGGFAPISSLVSNH